MNYNNITAEQLKKLSECQSTDEAMAYIREEGIELTDEQLESIAGGSRILDVIRKGIENAEELTKKRN